KGDSLLCYLEVPDLRKRKSEKIAKVVDAIVVRLQQEVLQLPRQST
ncbi:hypothetical protein Tco_0623570, partial [Tanacetum coccineum]